MYLTYFTARTNRSVIEYFTLNNYVSKFVKLADVKKIFLITIFLYHFRCRSLAKMKKLWMTGYVGILLILISPTSASVCPTSCLCSTTRDGLHRATCSDLAELYKFTLRQKHHNINILDLSHNNITKITHEIDRLSEVVTLDISNNGIKHVNKFLQNSKKLVHLNLANNRIEQISLAQLPRSLSSLDLTNNLLKDLPSNLPHLSELEHLQLEGNPLNCECENMIARDYLLAANVHVDNVRCFSPAKIKGRSWLELKTKDICKTGKLAKEVNYLDMMMGDQPNVEEVKKETQELKYLPLVALNDLEDGEILEDSKNKNDEDYDEKIFIKANNVSHINEFEGSGNYEVTTVHSIVVNDDKLLDSKVMESEGILPVEEHLTELTHEGSGEEGSGVGWISINAEIDTTTENYGTLYTGPIQPFFDDDNEINDPSSTTEYPTPRPVTIFRGGKNWIDRLDSTVAPVTEQIATTHILRDTTVSEQIRVTQVSHSNEQPTANNENVTPHKTGTYVCIAIILILLVGLIGFAIVKGQISKRRDRRILRQQKMDIEKASKEMVDMNTSLLGKPAPAVENPTEKKINGKYELVPTHEPHHRNGKKIENKDVGNGNVKPDSNVIKSESPIDTNQNKNSSKDNNIDENGIPIITPPQQETSFDSAALPEDKKDRHSLSSEEIFVPNEDDTLQLNGVEDSDLSQPLINGDPNTDSSFLSPTHDYVPVYSPDMGRVRIKLSETPKPKTPVLVTRSRSNAGDIIVTPTHDGNVTKAST